jgi:probable rRNA maturation factor
MAVAIRLRSTVKESLANPAILKAKAQALLSALELTRAELSILLTGDSEIRQLNRTYRQIDAPTDVLSFPMEDEIVLGDVVISVDTASRQAADQVHQQRLGKTTWGLDEELCFLLVHGVLHLIGYDHHSVDDDREMRDREVELFNAIQSSRPP